MIVVNKGNGCRIKIDMENSMQDRPTPLRNELFSNEQKKETQSTCIDTVQSY